MTTKSGQISVKTSDIFPIIKKWLYSEHDIFVRELISNASDAITKRQTLARNQGLDCPQGSIKVKIDKNNKQIIFQDNGLGMTEAEVEKYIAQLAFSGAEEFVQKMKDQGQDKKDEIIGKFGLGFYSAFMAANKVQIDSLSMTPGSTPTRWICEGDTDYTFEASDKTEVGTTITLFINQEAEEYLDVWKTRSVLRQYCDFMPYEIEIIDLNKEMKEGEEQKADIINEILPIWKKDPTTLKDEDYKEFYRKMFPMDQEPLFWLHLNVDHPFTLQGVLFFPKLNREKPIQEQGLKLYCKQVFVSDSVKHIVPEFLSLLKGAIDSTDIPLNVSRSSLQGDPNVKKISNYVIKKVAESLKKLFNTDRARYEAAWEDIGLFVKYGCSSDNKFDELMRSMVLFKNSEGKYITLPEYTASIPVTYQEKLKDKVITFERGTSSDSLRTQLLSEGIQTIETDQMIDPHFIQHTEFTKVGEESYKFVTVENEIENLLATDQATTEDDVKIKDLFKEALSSEDLEVKHLKNTKTAAYFKVDQEMKRFHQMTKMMNPAGFQAPLKKTLVINPNHPLIQTSLKFWEKDQGKDLAKKICNHVQDLANLSSEGLNSDTKEAFINRSHDLIQELSERALS